MKLNARDLRGRHEYGRETEWEAKGEDSGAVRLEGRRRDLRRFDKDMTAVRVCDEDLRKEESTCGGHEVTVAYQHWSTRMAKAGQMPTFLHGALPLLIALPISSRLTPKPIHVSSSTPQAKTTGFEGPKVTNRGAGVIRTRLSALPRVLTPRSSCSILPMDHSPGCKGVERSE